MSYARMTTIHTQAGKLDEAITIYRESVIPAAKRQKGYLGTAFLVDHASNKAVAMTGFASEAELQASEESGYYQEQVAKFATLLASAPVREVFEIATEDH